jgi:ATP-dependent RNA helicase SUPV3L1/SUV3
MEVESVLTIESYDRTVVPYLFKFIQQNFDYKKNKLFDNLVLLSELKNPGKLYPEARKMKRNIILHVGPTNSGKTYHALKKFKDSDSAIYCGPLRLLAHEVYEKCNAENIACNLLTGEERKESDNVNRWSSTVEMASTSRKFDLAVLDEIQMISDPQRGWAWTQAFYGIQAKELHLCGEPSAVNLIRKLCESTGEECEVRTYERLTGLQLDPKSLSGNLAKVERGDCIVAFSRKEIFQIKNYIEKNTKLKAAVIYGNLPPGRQ